MRRRYRHEVDDRFFDTITSEDQAYWLGFIAADGCILRSRPVISVKLIGSDVGHLILLKNALATTAPVLLQQHNRPSGGEYCHLRVTSRRLVDSLLSLGVGPCKSKSLDWSVADGVIDDLKRHFVRGYVDGDGHWGEKPSGDDSLPVFTVTCGSPNFLSGLVRYFRDELCLGMTLHPNGSAWRITSSSYSGCRAIYDLIYASATIFLRRKRLVASVALGIPDEATVFARACAL